MLGPRNATLQCDSNLGQCSFCFVAEHTPFTFWFVSGTYFYGTCRINSHTCSPQPRLSHVQYSLRLCRKGRQDHLRRHGRLSTRSMRSHGENLCRIVYAIVSLGYNFSFVSLQTCSVCNPKTHWCWKCSVVYPGGQGTEVRCTRVVSFSLYMLLKWGAS